MRQFWRDMMVLTKFKINVVGVVTGGAAMALFASQHPEQAPSFLVTMSILFGLLLMGSAANAANQVIEKDRDGKMDRTKMKRPLPSGRISVPFAWSFIAFSQIASMAIFIAVCDSWMAAGLSLFTFLYYTLFYTMYLKPRHYLNIVIGGVPGAMGPLIAWAALDHTISLAAWAMFTIIFLWTPPHFWALAIKLKEDYAKAGIPMLPVVKGVDETTRQIFVYTVVMVLGTLLIPFIVPVFATSPLYLLSAVAGGAYFLRGAWKLWRQRPVPNSMPLFHYSLMYIGFLFVGIIGDAVLRMNGVTS